MSDELLPFVRTWRVTLIRGIVALIPALALAAAVTGLAESGERGAQFLRAFGALVVFPGVWVAVGGWWVDHRLAHRGPFVAIALHASGIAASFVVLMIGGMLLESLTGSGETESLAVIFGGVATAVVSGSGLLLAWMVPGSYPRRGQAVVQNVQR